MSPRLPVPLFKLPLVILAGTERVMGRGAVSGLPFALPVRRPACATSPSPHP